MNVKKNIKRAIVFFVGIAVILSAILLVRIRKAELSGLSPPAVRPMPVRVETASQGRLPIVEHYIGTIEPVVAAEISAQATGYLLAVRKDVGDRLESGETIAEIDNRLLASRKDGLSAELAGAKEDFEIKKTIFERRKRLFENEVIARETLDNAALAYELADSKLKRLKQELAAATISLSYTLVQSPFKGIVTARMKNPGDLVMPGSPILTVEAPGKGYKVIVGVSQETVMQVSENNPVQLRQAGKFVTATVYRVHPAIGAGQLAAVEIRMPERPFGLPSHGTVGVDLTVGNPAGIVVAADTILEQASGAMVFEILENSTTRPLNVRVLGRYQGSAVVDGPLKAGTVLAAGPESMLLQLTRSRPVEVIGGGAR